MIEPIMIRNRSGDRRRRLHRLQFRPLPAARAPGVRVVNYDALTYAGNLENLAGLEAGGRYTFVKGDICDGATRAGRCCASTPSTRSSTSPPSATWTARSCPGPSSCAPTSWARRPCWRRRCSAGVARFVQVSTDEVYGSLGADGLFTEETPLAPNSPYSASKAGGRPAVPRLSPHLRPAGGHHALLEQLRPVPVSRKADPADDHQGAGGRGAAGLRRRAERARLDPRRGPLRGGPGGRRARRARRGLQHRREQRVAQHRDRQDDPEARWASPRA